MRKSLILIVICAAAIHMASAFKSNEFKGSETFTGHSYMINYELLNTTKSYSRNLQQGENVDIVISNQSGDAKFEITDSQGEVVYHGYYPFSGVFSLEMPRTDRYTFTITGVGAQGSASYDFAN